MIRGIKEYVGKRRSTKVLVRVGNKLAMKERLLADVVNIRQEESYRQRIRNDLIVDERNEKKLPSNEYLIKWKNGIQRKTEESAEMSLRAEHVQEMFKMVFRKAKSWKNHWLR
ncbi:unnamed protein product [Enterobius vermicularis]|uniref:Uncharacterized protein n=1 Tax=Enterobius vermicularis TaxID=51028 RepID=A0A0N4UYL8_ENTVE|nr:unnamed protein product [Enterobius vermicularis]